MKTKFLAIPHWMTVLSVVVVGGGLYCAQTNDWTLSWSGVPLESTFELKNSRGWPYSYRGTHYPPGSLPLPGFPISPIEVFSAKRLALDLAVSLFLLLGVAYCVEAMCRQSGCARQISLKVFLSLVGGFGCLCAILRGLTHYFDDDGDSLVSAMGWLMLQWEAIVIFALPFPWYALIDFTHWVVQRRYLRDASRRSQEYSARSD